jgi:hypothetical protein
MIEMPIFVQWKWVERTRTFLAIFHFIDDYAQSNIRIRRRKVAKKVIGCPRWILYPSNEEIDDFLKEEKYLESNSLAMSWAASHVEIGLLGELLRYANIIDGLDASQKRSLRRKLEIHVDLDEERSEFFEEEFTTVSKRLRNRILTLFERDKTGERLCSFCYRLCSEYIDYLKEILKPYLQT